MSQMRQKFAQLLTGAVNATAAFERKSTRAIAQEVGEAIGRTYHTIENYKSAKAAPTDAAQVRALALFGVTRARLNASWLREFLSSLDYADPEPLIAELCGTRPALEAAGQSPAAPWYDNLSAPPYGRFVMRHDALIALIDGLRSYHTVVLLGIGGMGKTSLAYYVATRCKGQHSGVPTAGGKLPAALPPVDTVIWLSDHNQPGALTLAAALDMLARTLDHMGLTALDPDAKLHAVETLLQRRQTLIILDNFETVDDPALLPWLLRLPSPTRALITTRVRRPEFLADQVCLLELSGMAENEVGRLVSERAAQIQLGGTLEAGDLPTLTALTGGNPLALRQIIGYLKRTGQSLASAAAAFGAVTGDVLPILFAQSWRQLPAGARYLLVTASLFPAPVTRAVIGQIAGLDEGSLDQTMAILTESALLEIGHGAEDGQPRVSLHPLTYHFVLEQHEGYADFLAAATERWLSWAVAYSAQFGYQLREPGRLRMLDMDQENLYAALLWASGAARDAAVVALCRGLEFYYYIGGWWGRKGELHGHYIAAAERSGDCEILVAALTMHIQYLCRLGRAAAADASLAQLAAVPGVDELEGEPGFHVAHARALYALVSGEAGQALTSWRRVLERANAWGLPDHMQIGAQHWIGMALLRDGESQDARQWFLRALTAARVAGYSRWIARNQIQLARLAIAQGALAEARERLVEAYEHTSADDREQLAHYYLSRAYLQRAQGRTVEAQGDYYQARDLFTRMGLAHELRDDASNLVTLPWDE